MSHIRNNRNNQNKRIDFARVDDGYRAMAADEERERAALKWNEALIGDGGLRPKGSEIVIPDLIQDPSIGGRARGNMNPGSGPG